MTDSLRPSTARCPPLRQARGTVLNTITEDTRESLFAGKGAGSLSPSQAQPTVTSPQLKLKTTGLAMPTIARLARFVSPLSAGTTSSCSDTEWQQQMRPFDDLYDATDDEDLDDDNETEIDECFSQPSTRPSSLVTPITRNSVTSTDSRKRSLALEIPSSNEWPSLTGAHKSSPIPPTPPPKIPVSPAALSVLARSVPASHAPPSLDGSISSDQESNLSALATPDTHSLPDANWDARDVHVRPELDGTENGEVRNEDARAEIETVSIAIESPRDDWREVLGSFPQIPSSVRHNMSSSSPPEDDGLSREPTPSDRGVFLPEEALAMLRHIPINGTPESWSGESDANNEMSQLQLPPSRPHSADGVTPASDLSGYSFSNLSIPSPGGFFASLGPRARHTWSLPNTNQPPSSAVAEGFYNLPWPRDEGKVVEQVIDWPKRPVNGDPVTAVREEDGPPTAIRLPCETPTRPVTHQDTPTNAAFDAVQEISRSGNGYEYDELYETELQERSAASLDRTSVWLAAQASYLAVLGDTNPVNETDPESKAVYVAEDELHEPAADFPPKKTVRFAEGIPEGPNPTAPELASKDSIYWRGFQSVRQRCGTADGFMHRNMRFDAVQSIRLGLEDLHINCLRGKYELVRAERPPYKGPFSQAPRNSVLPSVLEEKAQFSKLEKEQFVLAQLCQPMWAMDALRFLNGGKLLASPAAKRLMLAQTRTHLPEGTQRRSVRIMDLGGHASCEWAWHAAHEFPRAKVYTICTKQQIVNSAIKSPPNHRLVSVSHLWQLPFANNQFDVVSARSLHALLKTESRAALNGDEYDLVLRECLRCLKPGGYLEFMVLDAEIAHAGPYAAATSVEFTFNLRTRGYDPVPSKNFLGRLRNGGFVGIKRAWMFLPMGMEPADSQPPRETPAPRILSQIEEYEAVQGPIGSTVDIASMTGLVGGWMWEQWLLKLRMEMGREPAKLLEGVGILFDEGRKNGAGWTCLSGWAMKPKRRSLGAAHDGTM